MRSISIFHTDNGSEATRLRVNEDGSVTYHRENSGATLLRRGFAPYNNTMSAEEAKAKWPYYSKQIDQALAELRVGKTSN